jgi:hypothetical protein
MSHNVAGERRRGTAAMRLRRADTELKIGPNVLVIDLA